MTTTTPCRANAGRAWRGRRAGAALLALTLTGAVGTALGEEAPVAPPTLEEVVAHFGFDPADARTVRRGGIVSIGLEGTGKRELATAVVMIVRAPLEGVHAALRAGRTLRVNPDVVAHGALGDPPVGAEAFRRVGLGPDEADEVAELLDVEAGADFNLSLAEIARFEAVGERFRGRSARRSAAARAAVAGVWPRVLAARYETYRTRGLDAIEPYDREDDGSDRVRPGRELRAALAAATLLAKHEPTLHAAVASFPEGRPTGVVHDFFWMKQVVHDRPAFMLAHRLSRLGPDTGAVVELQPYVGHTYNTLLTVTGLVRVEGGTLVHHTNRTSTDHVAGLTRSVSRRLGRGRLRDAVVEHMGALRTSIEVE